MKLARIFLLVSLILAPLALINAQARAADVPLLETTTTVTATIRPTDTRWPTLTRVPSRTPTITQTPKPSGTPTTSRTPTITRTATVTRTATIGATPLNKPDLLSPAQDSVPDVIRPLFDWTDVLGATAYHLVVSRYSSFAYPIIDVTVTGSWHMPAADLPRDVTLYWRVQVIRPGLGLYASASFQSPNPPYSPAPISPGLNALVNGYTLINLDWAASVIPNYPPFDFYSLQVSESNSFYDLIVDFKEYRYSYHSYKIPATLDSNKTYFWRVCTYNTLGQRSLWRMSQFRTRLPSPTLISPAYLEVPQDLRPLLDWQNVDGATSYGLIVSARPDFLSPVVTLSVQESQYAPALDLPRNKVLYWRVRAHGSNISQWSKSSFTSPNPPDPALLLSPALDAQNVTLTPRLDWSVAIIPTGSQFAYYQLQVAGGNDFSHIFMDTTIPNIAQHAFTYTAQNALASWTTYHWRVRAFNTAGQSSSWVARFFTTRRVSSSPTPTPTPTPTLSPLTQFFSNPVYLFEFWYPENASLAEVTDTYTRVNLAIIPGTRLVGKSFETRIWDASAPCQSQRLGVTYSATERMSGFTFLYEEGFEPGAVNFQDWVSYSTVRNGLCLNMLFNLLYRNPNFDPTPLPPFDKATESAIFRPIASSMRWLLITQTPTPTPTVTPTATVSPLTQLYTNYPNGFQFNYPEDATLTQDDGIYFARIDLGIAPGTNLSEKYLEARAWDASRPCESPVPSQFDVHRTEIINGLSFYIQEGDDRGAGQIHEWVSYSTIRAAVCANLLFILHSTNPGMYETPPPLFDKAAESAVFGRMVQTFNWLPPTATPTVTSTPEQVSSAVFCADTRANTLLASLQTALNTSDGAALAALVNARHGVDIRLHARGSGVNFSPTTATSLFTSATSHNWGSAEGTGTVSIGAFNAVMLPLLREVFAAPTPLCNDDSTPALMGQAWPYPGINFYALRSPVDFPWRIIMVGVEYVDGQPYLFALINAQWGP